MNQKHKYLLDADTFIRAHRQHYRFKFCPAYWTAILNHHDSGHVASITQVRKELLRGKDDLSLWTKTKVPVSFFKGTEDSKVIQVFATISKWVASLSQLSIEAQSRFASSADGWLVAYAKVNGYSVCSYEVSSRESKSNIKLPDVCKQFGVPFVKPYDVLEKLDVRMILSKRATGA